MAEQISRFFENGFKLGRRGVGAEGGTLIRPVRSTFSWSVRCRRAGGSASEANPGEGWMDVREAGDRRLARVAIGPAILIGKNELQIPHRYLTGDRCRLRDQPSSRRPAACLRGNRRAGTPRHRSSSRRSTPPFSAHLMLARDKKLVQEIEEQIRKRRYAPEQERNMC